MAAEAMAEAIAAADDASSAAKDWIAFLRTQHTKARESRQAPRLIPLIRSPRRPKTCSATAAAEETRAGSFATPG